MQAGYNATARHNYGVGYYLQREEKRQVRIIQKVIQVLCFQKKVIQVLCFQKKKKKKKKDLPSYLPSFFWPCPLKRTFIFIWPNKNIHINSNDELEQPNLCVCVCVLNTKSNILHSHIPPKESKYAASLKEIMKNTKL